MSKILLERIRLYFCLLLCLFTVCSCFFKKTPPPQPSWDYAADGIILKYTSDQYLNEVDGNPHSIMVVIYQLEKKKTFQNLMGHVQGVENLLNAQRFDENVLFVRRFFVEPGQTRTITFDREENTRHIGIAVGFYNLFPKKACRLYDIPFQIKKKGFILKKKYADIDPYTIELNLGRYGIKGKRDD